MRHASSSRRIIFAVLATLALALGWSVNTRAQSTTSGAIGGNVEDPQGLTVPKAEVDILNVGTGDKSETRTNDAGEFRFSLLQPGTYSITITATNFAVYEQDGVTVEVGRVSTLEIKLTVASAKQTIQVSGEPPQVNTDTPDVSTNVNQDLMSNLPINGRRWDNFALGTPGVVPDGGFGLLSFRGVSGLLNNITVDGGDNNQAFFSEERGRTRIQYVISQDAISEFQVNTSNYSAQYGRSAGGVVNAVTKSGTNSFHGDAFYYFKDNSIGAQNPFTEESELVGGVPTLVPIKPPDRRQQFGGSIGGPIFKNKLFFYYSFDENHRNFPITAVPGSPNFLTSITPVTIPVAPANSISPLPGTSLCSSAITNYEPSATVNVTTALGPPPVMTPVTITTGNVLACRGVSQAEADATISFLNNLTGTVPRTGIQNINMPKLDWHINDKNSLSIVYTRMRWGSPAGIQTAAVVNRGIDAMGNDYVHDDSLIVRLNSTPRSEIANEALFLYSRDYEFEFTQPPAAGEPLTGPAGQAPDDFISASGLGSFEIGKPEFLDRAEYPLENRFQWEDTVSIVRGTHLIKFGVDFSHVEDAINNLFAGMGSYTYSGASANGGGDTVADVVTDYAVYLNRINPGTFTSAPTGCNSGVNYTGATPQPCYNEFTQAFGPPIYSFATNDTGLFIQDEWRIKPRLTVNVGLRWDFENLPKPQFPNSNAIPPGFTTTPTAIFPDYKKDFGPRIGIAWDVFGNGKTSVRAGYGLYYGRIINSTIESALTETGLAGQAQLTNNFFNSTSGNPTAGFVNYPCTYAGAISTASGCGGTFALPTSPAPGSATVVFFQPNDKNPQIQEADLAIQQDIGWHTVVSVSYLFSLGHYLPSFRDTNLNPSAFLNDQITLSGGPLNGDTFTIPVYICGSKPAPCSSSLRPNPNFGIMQEITDQVSSNYNALVVEVNRKLARELQIQASYTWSKAMDSGQTSQTFTPSSDSNFLDEFNPSLDYGNSNFDTPRRFVGSLVYTPRGFKHNEVAHALTSGWVVSPILLLTDNAPYSAGESGTPTIYMPMASPPASCSTTTPCLNSGAGGTTKQTNAVQVTGLFGIGGSSRIPIQGRNVYFERPVQNLNLHIGRRFRITESKAFEVDAECFNVFNRMNTTGLASSTAYGTYTPNTAGVLINGVATNAGTLTYAPLSANGLSGFGSVNNVTNTLVDVRQFQFIGRFTF